MDITLPFRYKKLAYAAINVTDLSRSVPFYRDIVGLDLVKQDATSPIFAAVATTTTLFSTRRPDTVSSVWASSWSKRVTCAPPSSISTSAACNPLGYRRRSQAA